MQNINYEMQNDRRATSRPGHFAFRISYFVFCIVCFISPTRMANACDTPVYRYALESWPADNYRGAVVHRGALPAGAQRLVDRLTERAGSANLSVQVIDLDGPRGE